MTLAAEPRGNSARTGVRRLAGGRRRVPGRGNCDRKPEGAGQDFRVKLKVPLSRPLFCKKLALRAASPTQVGHAGHGSPSLARLLLALDLKIYNDCAFAAAELSAASKRLHARVSPRLPPQKKPHSQRG